MPKTHTHYDTLSVVRNAPPEVIRAAYKTLSQKYHPDRNSEDANATAIMAKINEAYAVLSDPVKRKEYDKWLEKQESFATQQDEPAKKPEPEKKAAKSLDMQDLYAAVIGEKNTDYYLAKFAEFDKQKPGLKPSWNWFAFLFNNCWTLYRKMYGWFFTFWGIAILLNTIEKATSISHSVAVETIVYTYTFFITLIIAIFFGFFADSLYHKKVKKKIESAQQTIKNEAKLIEFLQSQGGVHNWVMWLFSGLAVSGIIVSIVVPIIYPAQKDVSPPAAVATNEPSPVSVESTATNEPTIANCKEEITEEQAKAESDCLWQESGFKSEVVKHRNDCASVEAQKVARHRKLAEQGCVESKVPSNIENKNIAPSKTTDDDLNSYLIETGYKSPSEKESNAVPICINGDCINGQATAAYSDGSKYIGEFKNSLREGQGIYIYSNGSKYVGEFKNDSLDGQGTFSWSDGSKYVGEFKNSLREGQGAYTSVNGR